jgi:carbon-monoxide dehydrogenase small subunit
MKVSFLVNGAAREVQVAPLTRLLDVLREQLGLIATKEGCGEGECGTCTVLLDGEPVNACLVPIGQVAGRAVVTAEGLVDEKQLSPLARAFVDRGGAQCGICTPGMIVSSHALLMRTPAPTKAQVREALAGNLCRCTGYTAIVEAVTRAAEHARAPAGGQP